LLPGKPAYKKRKKNAPPFADAGKKIAENWKKDQAINRFWPVKVHIIASTGPLIRITISPKRLNITH
jgi:hypothetical protein